MIRTRAFEIFYRAAELITRPLYAYYQKRLFAKNPNIDINVLEQIRAIRRLERR